MKVKQAVLEKRPNYDLPVENFLNLVTLMGKPKNVFKTVRAKVAFVGPVEGAWDSPDKAKRFLPLYDESRQAKMIVWGHLGTIVSLEKDKYFNILNSLVLIIIFSFFKASERGQCGGSHECQLHVL